MSWVRDTKVRTRLRSMNRGICCLILLANPFVPTRLWPQSSTTHHQLENTEQRKGCAPFPAHAIPDSELLDQDNRPVRFRTDLIADRTVAINFVYTSCETTCPLMGATFGKLQKLLGDRLEKDVRLISISVDPGTDTPSRLREWAAQFHAKSGWTLVTGQKAEIDKLLQALGEAGTRGQNHSVLVLVVNQSTNSWARVNGIGSSQDLANCVLSMADTR
jgi:protein SCO1